MANPKAILQANYKTTDLDKRNKKMKGQEVKAPRQIEDSHIQIVQAGYDVEDSFILIGEHPMLRLIPRECKGELNKDNNDGDQGPQNICIEEIGNVQTSDHSGNPLEGLDSNLVIQYQDDCPNGWTLVKRRRRKSVNNNQFQRKNQQSLLDIHAKKLRQQQKCFKCLLKGHV